MVESGSSRNSKDPSESKLVVSRPGNMECAIYAVFTSFWWISSATIFLPLVILLKFNNTFRHSWFSWLFTNIQPMFEAKLLPFRQQCFDCLKERLEPRDESIPLKVLEIGIGGGSNLAFYPENSSLIAVDMNPSFEKYFRKHSSKFPNIKLDRIVLAMAEDMKEVEDASVDVVISTYVLCSVTDVQKVLQEILRVLKPGGHFAFLEHVSYSKSEWSYKVQCMVAPLWSLYCDGCYPNRCINDQIKEAGFSDVDYDSLRPTTLGLFIRPHISGIATK